MSTINYVRHLGGGGVVAARGHRSQALRRPPAPFTPVGLGHSLVARCVVSKPGRALPPPINFARNSPATCSNIEFATLELQRFWGALVRVVTNVVNPRCFSCGFLIRCYKRRQSEGFFAENQGFWTQIDDVCNMSTRKGGSNCSGLTMFVTSAAHRHRRLAVPTGWPGCLKPLSPLLARACVGLKPPSPLLAQAEPQLKPLSPLLVRNGCFWRGFRLQR